MIDTSNGTNGAISDSILRQTLCHAAIGVAWLDPQGRIIAVNPTLATWLQRPVDQLVGQHLGCHIPALNKSRWRTLWSQLTYSPLSEPRTHLFIQQQYRQLDMLIQRLPGEQQDIAVVYLDTVPAPQEQNGLHSLHADVLEAVASGQPLADAMDLLCRRVEALAPDVICTLLLVDAQGRVHPLAAPGMPAAFSAAIDNEPIGPKAGSCGTAAYRGEPVEVTDIATDPLWERYRPLALQAGLRACWSSPIKAANGRVIGTFALYYRECQRSSPFHQQLVNACVHLCSLAIEHQEAQNRIRQLAFFDPLTGLPNRTLLQQRAHQELLHGSRSRQHLAVLFLDIDRFKTVNDSLGHHTGDQLLLEVSRRLLQVVRESDTVSRLGGDEFVILLPDCSAEHAHNLAEKILAALKAPFLIESHCFTPSASIGISIYPADGPDFDALLKHADAAMYRAKAAGRSTYRFFRQEMNAAANDYLQLEAALRQALDQGTIDVHFQPKIRIADRQLQGVEALARWHLEGRGMVPPATFIPLAEECGLIAQLDLHMLRCACRQLASWQQQGLPVPSVAVNFSSLNFRDADLVDTVARVLQECALAPQCLTLELTESLMLHSSHEVMTTLQRLRALGITLAVDDFGTGFSSLSYLHRFPVNELKLDQSFVRELQNNPDSRALASAIVSIGHRLHLAVVAEGVENAEQLAFLQAEGCDCVQGFHFARPMSAAGLEQWLKNPMPG